MSRTPWICQQCLRRLTRPLWLPSQRLRFASTSETPNPPSSTTDLSITAPTPPHDSISPALLQRARATAEEHTRLSTKIADSFDTASAKRLGELTPITDALQEWERASESIHELESLLIDPSSDAELRSLATDDLPSATASMTQASASLTAALVPRHPFAALPCLLEIRPGVGGSEAALFAGDLLRMYTAFCSSQGLRATLLKYEAADGVSDPNGSDAPLQEAILEVESEGAYDVLRCEAGVHRVQRVPATESKGRTHTSVATVLVLPSLPGNANDEGGMGADDFDDPESDYFVNPQDVRIDVMRARGAGGQHVNTTDSAVRLTHVPTGTVVAMQEERSQLKNRAKAWRVLRARLAQAKREAREEEMLRMRRSVAGHGKTGRGDKVRTYNWGQQRVTDHRSGITVHSLGDVMEGGESLGKVMDSVRAWLVDRDVEGLLAEEEAKAAAVQKGGK